jgi:hypothetical protein
MAASAKGLPPDVAAALLPFVGNGILQVQMDDSSGRWTVRTGASHPNPNQSVLFPTGTSFITLRDATALQMLVNGGGAGSPPPGLAGYTTAGMAVPVVTPLGSTGYRATFTLTNWTVVEDVVVTGTTLSDTNVRATVTITNTTASARQYGLRYMWDWEIAGNDGSFFRTRNPDTAFTPNLMTFNAPTFQLYEEVDYSATPTCSVFATTTGGTLSPPVTNPDQLRYSSWPSSVSSAWDYTDPATTGDSSVSYFWGFSAPLTLAAGATASFTQYITTQQSAIGPPTTATAANIPTLSMWALILLSTLALGLGAWSLRRSRNIN